MTSREEFEAWYLENWGHTEDDHETLFERCSDGEEYYRLGVRMSHEAWQAAELASEQKLTDMAVQLANAESKCRELAAENVGLKSGVTYFAFAPEYGFDYFANKQDAIDTAQAEIDAYRDDAFDGWDEDVRRVSWGIVIQQADGFDAEGVHISDSRHTYQTCDYQLVDMVKTPATDAFLAEVRASAIPEGYVLVPQEMHLSSEAMEEICFHCGDGGFVFGEFTDGLLFVGAIDDSDGQKIHGLHIATADYPEEGCATICEFLPVPHRGAAQ